VKKPIKFETPLGHFYRDQEELFDKEIGCKKSRESVPLIYPILNILATATYVFQMAH